LSLEWKAKKKRAIENFKAAMKAVTLAEGEELKIATMDGRVWTVDEMLREMELETDVGKENIEIWAMDIDKEVERLEHKYKRHS